MHFSKLSWLALRFTPFIFFDHPRSSCGAGFSLAVVSGSSSLVVVEGLLTAMVSLIAEPGVEDVRASVVA